MASQALYRKWRSQTFEELVGQEHVVQTLRNAIVEDRVGHAYLFTGPRGVGKTSMARLLSKAVNCLAPPAQRPCGTCVSCVATAEGRAVDVIEMDAASHTSVEDAREIIERVQFRPTTGRYKVYIIDEVHMLSTAAFNALLKTLEEPPSHALFILATTEVHKVPATILSRCQRFTFTRHTISEIANHLQGIADQEGLQMEAGVSQAIARAATGSMRDALGVLEQLAAFGSGSITLEQVQSLLGMSTAAEIDSLVVALLNHNVQVALRVVNNVADQGTDMRQFARDLVERLRALMLFVATGDRALLDISDDDLDLFETWAHQSHTGSLVHWIRLLSGLDFQLRTSPYGHLPLELALVEALVVPTQSANVSSPPVQAARPVPARTGAATPTRKPAPTPSRPAAVDSSQQDVGKVHEDERPAVQSSPIAPAIMPAQPAVEGASGEETPTSEPLPEPEVKEAGIVYADIATPEPALPPLPEQSVAAAPTELEAVSAELSALEQIEAVWADVVRDVRVEDMNLQAILRGVQPVDVEGATVVLLAQSKFHHDQVEKPHSRLIVETILSRHLGSNFRVRCVRQEQTRGDDPRKHIQASLKDPLVKAARNIFGAEVIGVETADQERG